jgi:hypothetical protein
MKTKQILLALAITSLTLAGCSSMKGARESHDELQGTQSNAATPSGNADVQQQGISAPLSASNKIPAAEGTVKVSPSQNNNTKVDLEVKHLARPEKVNPQAGTYMVWQKSAEQNGQIVPLGALNVDKDLTGHLQTVTPMKDFEIFVTAEPSATVAKPSGDKLLWTSVSR